MLLTGAGRTTVISPKPPLVPRLRLEPTLRRRTLLDGGWWPRSADPVAELPGLILAIDGRHGLVIRLMLGPAGWDSRPRRFDVGNRVIRLGWFTTQPAGLLTAICANGERVDLLVIPPATGAATAQAAMELAAQATNTIHTPNILTVVTAGHTAETQKAPESGGESERSRPPRKEG